MYTTAETPEAIKSMEGDYEFAGGDAEREQRKDAIDDAIADMNMLVRGVARKRLLASTAIPDRLEVSAKGTSVTVSFDDRLYTAALGAPPVVVTGTNGDDLDLTHRLDGKRLMQEFVGPKGGRINALRKSGDEIEVDIRVHSESLPGDVVYTLTYEAES